MQFKYLWKISSKKNNLMSLEEEKIFRPHFTQQHGALNARFILWFIGFVIAWPRGAERGPLLTRRTDKRMHAHVCTCAPSGGNCGCFFGILKYVFKRCDPFLRTQIGLSAETSSAFYGHMCARVRKLVDQKWARSVYSRTKEQAGEPQEEIRWDKKVGTLGLQIRFSAKWQLCQRSYQLLNHNNTRDVYIILIDSLFVYLFFFKIRF